MFNILTAVDRKCSCECRMCIWTILKKVGQTVNCYLKTLEFKKFNWILTHTKCWLKERLTIALEREMPLPELRCKWDGKPKSITWILLNSKCEVGSKCGKRCAYLKFPLWWFIVWQFLSGLTGHTAPDQHAQMPFCRTAPQTLLSQSVIIYSVAPS